MSSLVTIKITKLEKSVAGVRKDNSPMSKVFENLWFIRAYSETMMNLV
jgi:hypothetical protein